MRQNRAAALKQRKEQITKLQSDLTDLSRKVTIKPHSVMAQGGKSSFYLQQLLNVTSERVMPQSAGVNQSFFLPSNSRHHQDMNPRRGRSRSNPRLTKMASHDPTANILSELDPEPLHKHASTHSPLSTNGFSHGQVTPSKYSASGIDPAYSQGTSAARQTAGTSGPAIKPFQLDATGTTTGPLGFLQHPVTAAGSNIIGDYSGVGSHKPEKKEPPTGPPKPKQQPQEEDSMMGKLGKWFSNTFS